MQDNRKNPGQVKVPGPVFYRQGDVVVVIGALVLGLALIANAEELWKFLSAGIDAIGRILF